jgi:hypothetical protein
MHAISRSPEQVEEGHHRQAQKEAEDAPAASALAMSR